MHHRPRNTGTQQAHAMACTRKQPGRVRARVSRARAWLQQAHFVDARQGVHDDGVLGQYGHGLVVDDVLAAGLLVVVRPVLHLIHLCSGTESLGRAQMMLPCTAQPRSYARKGKKHCRNVRATTHQCPAWLQDTLLHACPTPAAVWEMGTVACCSGGLRKRTGDYGRAGPGSAPSGCASGTGTSTSPATLARSSTSSQSTPRLVRKSLMSGCAQQEHSPAQKNLRLLNVQLRQNRVIHSPAQLKHKQPEYQACPAAGTRAAVLSFWAPERKRGCRDSAQARGEHLRTGSQGNRCACKGVQHYKRWARACMRTTSGATK